MKKVNISLLTHRCGDPNCEYKYPDYELNLTEKHVEITFMRNSLRKNPYKWKLNREYLLDWLLSLNFTKSNWKGVGHLRIEDFITLASYIFPDDYHIRLRSVELDEAMNLEDFIKLLHPEHKNQDGQDGWKSLMVKREPRMFHPHTTFYNPFWFDYRNKNINSKLIESSSGRIEEFLNMLYEISPLLLKKYIEKVEIDEDEPERWGYIYLHKKLKNCVEEAWWSREVCLISASDTIRSRLKYDKSCIERSAEELV